MKVRACAQDFKNAKIEIHNLFLMRQFFGDLATKKINMSAIHDLNFISK